MSYEEEDACMSYEEEDTCERSDDLFLFFLSRSHSLALSLCLYRFLATLLLSAGATNSRRDSSRSFKTVGQRLLKTWMGRVNLVTSQCSSLSRLSFSRTFSRHSALPCHEPWLKILGKVEVSTAHSTYFHSGTWRINECVD